MPTGSQPRRVDGAAGGCLEGVGLFEGLGDLGISHHNTIAIGDAENDHSLLEVCEVGVAVSNAVDSLKAHADLVLDQPDGTGLASFLRGPVVAGRQRLHPRRWRLDLGTVAGGTPVSIPASQLNVLIAGSPRRGKSFVAGLIAERLIGLGYSVLVIDPEGDHTGLGRLRGVLVMGGESRFPSPHELVRLTRHRFGSVILDLSAMSSGDRAEYLRTMPAALEAQMTCTGLPHWVVVDEAHEPLGRHETARTFLSLRATGFCLATHRPADLCMDALLGVDVVIALPGGREVDATVDLLAAGGGMPHSEARELLASAGPGQAVLIDRRSAGEAIVFSLQQRATGHVRHWHKYAAGRLPPDRRFYFRRDWDTATGTTAGNIAEFEHELRHCSEEAIGHHCAHGDFSRWIAEVLGDPPLGADVSMVEADVRSGASSLTAGRRALVAAVHERHAG